MSWFKKFGAFAQVAEGFIGVFEFGSDEELSADENYPAIATKKIFIKAISLAHKAFNTVANDCAAEFFACREADFAVIAFVTYDEQN